MKTTMYVAVLALFSISCKKDPFTIPDLTPQPVMQAKIYPAITEPREAILGDSNAIFNVGDILTIYVPYTADYDRLTSARLLITDETGELMDSFDITEFTDMQAGALNVPQQLQGARFVFATIEIGELYAGKTVNIQSQLSGDLTVSDDYLPNAFSVRQ